MACDRPISYFINKHWDERYNLNNFYMDMPEPIMEHMLYYLLMNKEEICIPPDSSYFIQYDSSH